MKLITLINIIRKITDNYNPDLEQTFLTQEFKGISTDSRTITPGEIFLALTGENFDGHHFIPQAIERGAIAVITNQDYHTPSWSKIPQLKVKNTLNTYQEIARWWRQQFDIPVIGITGSVGKTTTKELISAVLSKYGKVLKTTANYNNEIGVPQTLLQITNEHDFAVIEMAMRAKGEIALLTQITQPTIGVITNVGTAHIGRLGSREAIASAKCELLAHMNQGGIAILNGDNDLLVNTAQTVWQGETITYGLINGNFRGRIIEGNQIQVGKQIYPLPLTGEHNALNYLGSIAVAQALGLNLEPLTTGIEVILPQGRAKRYQLASDIEVFDETYNAGLESMVASLKLLQQSRGKRKIAILGTMKELGTYSEQLHYQVGQTVRALNLDRLFILADEVTTYQIAEGATGIKTEIFTQPAELVRRLSQIVEPGDSLLFKASNSVGLNRVLEKFCQYLTEQKEALEGESRYNL
jgi:UDP-N-acetylmuramoyl-tripeptide--D-alanyl-D-alanine ligase